MNEKEAQKVIGKLSGAVVLLSAIIIMLVFVILGLYAFKQPGQVEENFAWCGTRDSEFFCLTPGPGTVFYDNCASCHFVDKDMTGPAIQGAVNRGPYSGWFKDFLFNEDSLLNAGEPYTTKLNEAWRFSSWTHDFGHLTDEQLSELTRLAY